MRRAGLAPLAALAGVAALSACGKTKPTPPGAGFHHPSSVAIFRGVTIDDPNLQPYFAVANELGNDLTIVNANTDAPVLAPVKLRSLAVSVQFRPTIVVSASLGDGLADLLVAIAGDSTAGGNSSLQLVRTWDAANDVVDAQTVDVAGEVVAAAAVPNQAGTTGKARIALALSDRRIVLVEYARSGVEIAASTPSTPLALSVQPVALAASDDGTTVYAATPDEFTPGAGDFGVAEIDVRDAPTFSRRIDARGPTRLVAFANVRERVTGPATSGASTAADSNAFAGQGARPRLYAVLDESGCGPTARIPCGVVVLDAAAGGVVPDVVLPPTSGTTIPMPYLAPIQLPAHPIAISIALPTAVPPTTDTNDVVYTRSDSTYHGDLMRLWPAPGALATTAVAAVPCDDGHVYFIDLGRWKVTDTRNVVASTTAVVTLATATAVEGGTVRLSLANLDGSGAILSASADAATATPAYVRITPGYTRTDTFSVDYQAPLPSLAVRRAEAGVSGGQPWLAMQVTSGSIVAEVVRLWDPSLGVKVGDVVQIEAAGIPAGTPACVGTEAPGAVAGSTKVFEARVAALVQPSAAYPGGAVQLAKETLDPVPLPVGTTAGQAVALWGDCFDRLAAGAAAGTVANLTASILAGDLVVTSGILGTVGRPALDSDWALDHDAGEDTLSCPLLPWPTDPTATACDATTCRPACDHLLAVRRARRNHHVAEGCGADTACQARFPASAAPGDGLPDVAGPVVRFRVTLDARDAAGNVLSGPQKPRGLHLAVTTTDGVSGLSAPPSGTSNLGSITHPNGAATFDRSPHDAGSGYRFLVPYAGDWVLDTSPSLQNAASSVIR